MVVFPNSGNRGRRLCLVHSDTIRASPSPLSSPLASWTSLSSTPLPIWPGSHRRQEPHPSRWLPSAAELAAGDSVHVGDHGGYPRVRLDLLSTPMFSDPRGVLPFTGEPRRSSASVRSRETARAW